jgi:hypothetical protein
MIRSGPLPEAATDIKTGVLSGSAGGFPVSLAESASVRDEVAVAGVSLLSAREAAGSLDGVGEPDVVEVLEAGVVALSFWACVTVSVSVLVFSTFGAGGADSASEMFAAGSCRYLSGTYSLMFSMNPSIDPCPNANPIAKAATTSKTPMTTKPSLLRCAPAAGSTQLVQSSCRS